jgi:hypothetical protein
MMIICGIITAIWVFMPDIMPSMAVGSVSGFGWFEFFAPSPA